MSCLIKNIDTDYLDLCRRILDTGDLRKNQRTGVDCFTVFGERLTVDLTQGFPLITTRRIFWKGILRELLWFISGSVDVKKLQEQNVHIWDGNSTREFLDKRGLTDYPEGNIGPSYGWQWRNFGSLTTDPTTPPQERGGIDQLQGVINKLKEDPTDRRLVVTSWNPSDLPRIALPPCHILYQFFVKDNNLSCQLYQRSCDVALGLPFNIASYALLTHIIAAICGLGVSKLIICLGDTHIYANHRDAVTEQLTRSPKKLPKLLLKSGVKDLDSLKEEHIELIDYLPHPQITGMTMVI